MTFWNWILRFLSADVGASAPATLQLSITQPCLNEIRACIQPDLTRRHEGICYLLGRTNGTSTRIDTAIRPTAVTTPGSFFVEAQAMAMVVRMAAQCGQQVVGQLHTHPREAYHSAGDDEGARIRYKGYVSIVLPDYGKHLPDLRGAAIFIYQPPAGFTPLALSCVRIVQDGWYA